MVLLTLLAAVTVGIMYQRNLFAVVMLASGYSFLMASVMIVLDAVDVAMTEAAVGAGISTVLLLAALSLIGSHEMRLPARRIVPSIAAGITGAALIYATLDLPPFGAADTPVNQHIGPYYLENSIPETTIPNVVTSVLASYRGFDTLGEVTVIFTAGIAVLMLLGGERKRMAGERRPRPGPRPDPKRGPRPGPKRKRGAR